MKKLYGKKNAKRRFYPEMHIKLFFPKPGGKRFQKGENILFQAGWNLPLQKFYCLKYTAVFLVVVLGTLVIGTNSRNEMNLISSDLNYKRSATDYSIEITEENIALELQLMKEAKEYLTSVGLAPSDDIALQSLQAYFSTLEIPYDNPSSAAKRVLLKLNQIQQMESSGNDFLMLFILAYLCFKAFELLAYVKILLIYSKKDWEDLNCLAVYSIVSRLPPYHMDYLIHCMKSVCFIYRRVFDQFQEAIAANDSQKTEQILMTVEDESMQEILETLVLAQEIGIEQTAENIDDVLDTKLSYMEVTANKRRQIKVIIAIIPAVLILFYLFRYLMFGVVFIIQNSMIVL